MKIISPSFTIESEVDDDKILKQLERAGRTAYKSENKITNNSAKEFITIILNHKPPHYSVIEHGFVSVRIICDRGVSHEIVRHRIASFTQECLTGDAEVRKGVTIRQLYDRMRNCYGKTHNKTPHLRSCDENGNIVPNKMVDVLHKGIGDVYEVITERGYKLQTTLNHQFMLPNGTFTRLGDLAVGAEVAVNGRPSLIPISDSRLVSLYNEEKLSPIEIAELYAAPLASVYRRLKQLCIFVRRKNDKNKEKYNRNHTRVGC